jgi:alpha-1,2-mannosyltransferase
MATATAAEELQRPAFARRLRAAHQILAILLLGIAPVALAAIVVAGSIDHRFAFDFHSLWEAARAVRSGRNPYPPATIPALAAGEGFVYPPVVAFAALPLGLLPFGVAATIMVAALVGCTAATLRVLGVRDWRCYGAAYVSVAVLHDIRLGALTPLLALGLALAWQWRARARAVIPLALIVVAKLFLWPLGVWLLATGRARLAVRTAALALGASALGWAAIGFAGLHDYPRLLSVLADDEQARGYSLTSAGLALGLGPGAARAAAAAVGAGLLALCWREGRRGFDERSLAFALAAALALSPIVWLHYFVLLLVPIVLARRTFGAVWLVPALFWVTPYEENFGAHWRIAAGVVLTALAVGAAVRARTYAPAP